MTSAILLERGEGPSYLEAMSFEDLAKRMEQRHRLEQPTPFPTLELPYDTIGDLSPEERNTVTRRRAVQNMLLGVGLLGACVLLAVLFVPAHRVTMTDWMWWGVAMFLGVSGVYGISGGITKLRRAR